MPLTLLLKILQWRAKLLSVKCELWEPYCFCCIDRVDCQEENQYLDCHFIFHFSYKNKPNLNDTDILKLQEKEKLLQEAEEKEATLEREREMKEQLAKKISAMESKLLCGGKNIIDHTNEQQRALEMKRQEIADQKVSSYSPFFFQR